MPYQPIAWARSTVGGRQIEADGSRLLNLYPAVVSDRNAKVPTTLHLTPGVRRWANLPNPTFVGTGELAVGTATAPVQAAAGTARSPGTVQNLTATPGNAQVSLSWEAPASDGGSPLTKYALYVHHFRTNEQIFIGMGIGLVTSYVVTGLTNDQEYTFQIWAINAVGAGRRISVFASPVGTESVPSLVQNLTVSPADGQVRLDWLAPLDEGGSPIVRYGGHQVPPNHGNADLPDADLGLNTSFTLTGLTNGQLYRFEIWAVNSQGAGARVSVLLAPVATGQSLLATLDNMAPTVGDTVTCHLANTAPGGSLSYQWSLNDVAIPGATNVSYTVVAGDAGQVLSCLVVESTDSNTGVISGMPGAYGLIGIDSPIYGRALGVVFNQYWFVFIRLGGRTPSPLDDIPASYDPISNPATLYTLPTTSAVLLTNDINEAVTGPVRMVTDNQRILIVLPGQVRAFDLSDGHLVSHLGAPIAPDQSSIFPDQEWVDAAWMDGYFFLASRGGFIFHSNYQSLEFDQLDFAPAQSKPDEVVGLAAWNARLYIFGKKTIERWYNTGAAVSTFSPDGVWTSEIGCASRDSIAVDEEGIFFLASNGSVYFMSGTNFGRISTDTIDTDIAPTDWARARGFTYTEEGHRFYVLTLSNGRSWAYDLNTRTWHERDLGDILAFTEIEGLFLAGRAGQPCIFSYSLNHGVIGDLLGAYVEAPIDGEVICSTLHSDQAYTQFFSFQTEIPYREGGEVDDTVSLSWSNDNSRTWVPNDTRRLGIEGDPNHPPPPRFKWNRLGTSRFRNFRLQVHTHRRVTILGAYIESDALIV